MSEKISNIIMRTAYEDHNNRLWYHNNSDCQPNLIARFNIGLLHFRLSYQIYIFICASDAKVLNRRKLELGIKLYLFGTGQCRLPLDTQNAVKMPSLLPSIPPCLIRYLIYAIYPCTQQCSIFNVHHLCAAVSAVVSSPLCLWHVAQKGVFDFCPNNY